MPNDGKQVTLQSGWGYWDLTHYPYGGDFHRLSMNTTAEIIGEGSNGTEVKVRLSNGTVAIIKKAAIVEDMKKDSVYKPVGTFADLRRQAGNDVAAKFSVGQEVELNAAGMPMAYKGDKVKIIAVEKSDVWAGGNKAFGVRPKKESSYRYQVQGSKGTGWVYEEDLD